MEVMQLKRSRFLARPAALLLAAVLLVCNQGCGRSDPSGGGADAAGDSSVTVGALLSLTGDEANYGQWAREALDIAAKKINATGGINGMPLRIVYEDDLSDNDRAVSGLKKLIDVDKVFVVIGATRSGSTLAAAPVANSRQVVLITPTSGSPKIADAGDFVFRTRESGDRQAAVLVRYATSQLGLKRIAIYHPQEANAVGYKDAFVSFLKAAGIEPISVQGFPETQQDLRTDLIKLAERKPEAVYVPGTAAHIARVLRQADEIGLKTQFLSSTGAENPELITIAGKSAEGLVFATMAFDAGSNDPEVADFVKSYGENYKDPVTGRGREPNAWAATAYDTLLIVASTLRGEARTGSAFRDALYAMKPFLGISGKVSFDSRGEAIKSVAIKVVDSGRFVMKEVVNE